MRNHGKKILCLILLAAGAALGGQARAGGRAVSLPAAGRGVALPPAAIAPLGASLTRSPLLQTPLSSLPLTPALSPAAALTPAAALFAPDTKEGPEALGAVRALAAELQDKPQDAHAALGERFDGTMAPAGGELSVDAAADAAAAPTLSNPYPRVVFIQDVFERPASEGVVTYLEHLADVGVRLVFLTSRPLKGPGSADEMLLSRLKVRRTNPLIVVSHNGARINLHGRAAHPKPVIADLDAFGADEVSFFKSLNGKASKSAGLKAGQRFTEEEVVDDGGVLAFRVRVPDSVSDAQAPAVRAKAVRAYNRLLSKAGLPYAMTTDPSDPRAAAAYSMPLRFSLPRVMEALDEQFRGEDLPASPEKFLIIADSARSPRFSSAFPKQAEVQVAADGEELEHVLGAVLGRRTLPTVSIKLGKLRQFVEYWEPSRHGRSGGGAPPAPAKDRAMAQKFAMYTGTVLYQLMAWTYEQIWRGQHQLTHLAALQARLAAMWYQPLKHGVYVNKALARVMKTKAWKDMQGGYLQYATSYLINYYLREFGNYSVAARNVQTNLVGLATDRKSLITLEFVSPSTGRAYKIHTRIPRVMKLDTAEGLTLVAYSYRTGKETPDDGEEFLARILAMALLKGYARKGPDGKWHHGSPEGPVIGKLKVQLEYRSSHRSMVYDTEDFLRLEDGLVTEGPIVQEITSAIEREEADAEYQKYYQDHEEGAAAAQTAKKRTRKPAPTPESAE